jgi:hypothetical protein
MQPFNMFSVYVTFFLSFSLSNYPFYLLKVFIFHSCYSLQRICKKYSPLQSQPRLSSFSHFRWIVSCHILFRRNQMPPFLFLNVRLNFHRVFQVLKLFFALTFSAYSFLICILLVRITKILTSWLCGVNDF